MPGIDACGIVFGDPHTKIPGAYPAIHVDHWQPMPQQHNLYRTTCLHTIPLNDHGSTTTSGPLPLPSTCAAYELIA